MQEKDPVLRVCIYLQTTDRYRGRSLYQAVVGKAKALGIVRVAALQGCMGYGGSDTWHVEQPWKLCQEIPVMIEVLDRESRLRQLLNCLDDMCSDGMVTVEPVKETDFKGLVPVAPAGRLWLNRLYRLLGCFKRRVCLIYLVSGG